MLVPRPVASSEQKADNRSTARLRASGGRATADLKSWRILRKIRSSPAGATLLANAIHMLTREG